MPPLTPREQQVLQQLVRGASNKEIARALNLFPANDRDLSLQPVSQAGRP